MRVETVAFEGGEQFLILVDSKGMPIFMPTVFTVKHFLLTGKSVNTVDAVLRAIMFGIAWGQKHGIDIEKRYAAGEFLSIDEIESLIDSLALRYDDYKTSSVSTNKVVNISRKPKLQNKNTVAARTQGNRARYILHYLNFLALDCLSRLSHKDPRYAALDSVRLLMEERFMAWIPSSSIDAREFVRQGLSVEEQTKLLNIVDPNSKENPWKDPFTRVRNQLIVQMGFDCCERLGEKLTTRISDVNLATGELHVRDHDNNDDSRIDKPSKKTGSRSLPVPLGDNMMKTLDAYLPLRRQQGSAKKRRDFLLVARRTGAPLSRRALMKVYEDIVGKFPIFAGKLTDHVTRHTWNLRYSELCDRDGTKPEAESARRELMNGWVVGSRMTQVYNLRHEKNELGKQSRKMQEDSIRRRDEMKRMDEDDIPW